MPYGLSRACLAIGLACSLSSLVFACTSEKEAIAPSKALFEFAKPTNFPEPIYTFESNPITEEGFRLGRKLFFDPILSSDGSVSCNNCHIQSNAFADAQQHPFSVGVDNRIGKRNAPPLMNLAFMKEFFWDGGVTHLDFVPINAIESDVEMNETLAEVIKKLNAHPEYPMLFEEVFGSEEVTSPFMLQALSQFMLMLVSADTRYDRFQRGVGEELSTEESIGLQLFKEKCANCHQGELFSDFSYRNNGIGTTDKDPGRSAITDTESDFGKFRVPSLRNVALTAPYMHNAKFATLEEVMDHYDRGVVDSPTLDPILKNEGILGISISEDEKKSIIAFLRTLTDHAFRLDSRFQNP